MLRFLFLRATGWRALLLTACVYPALLSVGCQSYPGAEASEAPREGLATRDDFTSAGSVSKGALADSGGKGRLEAQAQEGAGIDRKLVHTGALVLGVSDAAAARARLREITESSGGYVQSESNTSVVLRIPSERWRESFDACSRVGREISRRIDVQDVTEQYFDIELRIKNARALRDRLEQLLQKANDVKSALEVEKELTRVRLEIEQLEATLRTLGQRVSFGTLGVDLQHLSQAPSSGAALPFSWLHSLGVENLLGTGGRR